MAKDITVKVFDNFYNLDLSVNANEYEIVFSFFKEYTSTEEIAQSFTDTLFRISNITDQNVLELLKTFEGLDNMQIVLTLAYYLNTISKTKTIMYGINSLASPNEKIQRNILQDGEPYQFPTLSIPFPEINNIISNFGSFFADVQLGFVNVLTQRAAIVSVLGNQAELLLGSVLTETSTQITVDVTGIQALASLENVSIYIGDAVWVDVSGQEFTTNIGEVTVIITDMIVDFVGIPNVGVSHHKVKLTDLTTDSPIAWDWRFYLKSGQLPIEKEEYGGLLTETDLDYYGRNEQNPIAVYYYPTSVKSVSESVYKNILPNQDPYNYAVRLTSNNEASSGSKYYDPYIKIFPLPKTNVKMLQITPGYIAYNPFNLETDYQNEITLKNVGDASLTINYFGLEKQSPWFNATFTTSWTGNVEYNSFYQMPPGTTLAPNESKTMIMTWRKTQNDHENHNLFFANYTGTEVVSDGTTYSSYFEYIELDFGRTRNVPILQIDPVQLTYTTQRRVTSDNQTITLKNAGNYPIYGYFEFIYDSPYTVGQEVGPLIDGQPVSQTIAFSIQPYSSITYQLAYLCVRERLIDAEPLEFVDVMTITSNNYYLDKVPLPINVTILPLEIDADFEADQTTVVAGSTVRFDDRSTQPDAPAELPVIIYEWNWVFQDSGGNNNSTSNSPIQYYTYSTPGDYTVSLTINNFETTDTETKINYIKVLPLPVTIIQPNGLLINTYLESVTVLTDEAIPLTIDWVTSQFGIIGNLIQDPGWKISNEGRTIRFNVEPSRNCVSGGNPNIQSGSATATINTGSNAYYMKVVMSGLGEVQDSGYENMFLTLNGTIIVSATSNDLDLGCSPDAPVFQQIYVPGPYLLGQNTTNTFDLSFNTADPLFHINAYYELDLSFYSAPPPVYYLSKNVSSVTEGQSFTVTLTTANVPNGTNVPYTITGVTSSDIGNVSLSGNFVVNNNTAQIIFTATADNTTEFTEQFILTLDEDSRISVTVGIFQGTPTYQLTSSSSVVNEGQTFTITLTTTNVPNGVIIPYTITGVSSADLSGANLNGSFTISNSQASVQFTVIEDLLLEGTETFRLTLLDIPLFVQIPVQILDTSVGLPAATLLTLPVNNIDISTNQNIRNNISWYNFVLTNTRVVTITTSGFWYTDTELGLYSSDGTLLQQNDNYGGAYTSRINTTLTSGTYYLAVGMNNTTFGNNFSAVSTSGSFLQGYLTASAIVPPTVPMSITYNTEIGFYNDMPLIIIGLQSSLTNVTIDWGDGNIENVSGYTYQKEHEYATHGIYTVTILGILPAFGDSDGTTNDKIISINSWGDGGLYNLDYALYAATNLVSVPNNIPSTVTSVRQMFSDCTFVGNELSAWNVSNITDMSYMFYNAINFNGDISGWNTSSVIDMTSMFYNAVSFNRNISGWNTSLVNNMSYMFYTASSFNRDLSGWCVPTITFEPEGFSAGATNWTLPKPVWGTCP